MIRDKVLSAVTVLMVGLFPAFADAGPPDAADPDPSRIVGVGLSPAEIEELEEQVEANPEDLASRVKLLDYYQHQQFFSREASAARATHVLWVIENRPESRVAGWPLVMIHASLDPVTYVKGRELWLGHAEAQPRNPVILGNAADYFMMHDHETAEKLLLQAEAVDPDNPEWPERLGEHYRLELRRIDGTTDEEPLQKTLEAYERALPKLAGFRKTMVLLETAKIAVCTDDLLKAERYAREALDAPTRIPMQKGEVVHHGNLVMGRVALLRGDIDEAENYLIAAGKTSGSTSLGSFGPNMLLAQELLAHDRDDVVIEYLVLCRRFWKDARLDTWIADIENGRTPDFGANLVY